MPRPRCHEPRLLPSSNRVSKGIGLRSYLLSPPFFFLFGGFRPALRKSRAFDWNWRGFHDDSEPDPRSIAGIEGGRI